MTRVLAIAALLLLSAGCGLVGPHCTNRQERGTAAIITGSVGAGEVMVHRVAYDTRGSQNDARIDWPGRQDPDAARLTVYATLASCEGFVLPADTNSGACAVVARGGWSAQGIATSLTVAHGRGNPEQFGNPAEYKLWITSDRSTSYSIVVSYFFGPDC
jgi:hypothetical protein